MQSRSPILHSRTHAKLASLHFARQLTLSAGSEVAVAVGAAVAVPVAVAVGAPVVAGGALGVAVPGAVGIGAGAAVAAGSAVVAAAVAVALALAAASPALAGVHFPDHVSQSPTATITIAPVASREIVPSHVLSVVNRHDASSAHVILLNSADPGATPSLIDPPITGTPPTETDCDAPMPGPVTVIPVDVRFSSSVCVRSPPSSASCRVKLPRIPSGSASLPHPASAAPSTQTTATSAVRSPMVTAPFTPPCRTSFDALSRARFACMVSLISLTPGTGPGPRSAVRAAVALQCHRG